MTILEERTTFMVEGAKLSKSIAHEIERTSSTKVETKQMGIDQESMYLLMDLLTNLYSNPEKSVVQEYISNAIDSHTEAGQTDPILVTLPSYLTKTFTVQDFGTGMSKEEMQDIYIMYGKSTKRNNMDAIGAFGLGSKAGLAVANSFTVTSVKDGWKTVMVMSRGEDGGGDAVYPVHIPTDEPNGVTVSVPVDDIVSYRDYTYEFCKGLRPGQVEVDGVLPPSHYSGGDYIEEISTQLIGQSTYWNRHTFVNIGGIVYEVDRKTVGINYNPNYNTVTDIPIGSVDLTPSRDDLRYTPRTIDYLKTVVKTVEDKVIEYIENLFLNTSGPYKSVEVASKYRSTINNSENQKVVQKREGLTDTYPVTIISPEGQLDQYRASYTDMYSVGVGAGFLVTDDPKTRGLKTWVKRWVDNGNHRVRYTVHPHDKRTIRAMRRMKLRQVTIDQLIKNNKDYLDEIRDIRGPAEPREALRYRANTAEIGHFRDQTLEDFVDCDIIIEVEESSPLKYARQYLEEKTGKSVAAIDLGHKKFSALKKRLENLGHKGEILDKFDAHKKMRDLLTDDDYSLVVYHNQSLYYYQEYMQSVVKISRNMVIEDPEFNAIADIVEEYESTSKEKVAFIQHIRVYSSISERDAFTPRAKKLIEKYPLVQVDSGLERVLQSDIDIEQHNADYINAIYRKGI